ncbi:MAG: hypothetical protein AB1668_01280 [Nanoarchaeota archaeon]
MKLQWNHNETTMKSPTFAQCYELFEHYKVPGTVQAHCRTVFKVASFLGEELVKHNYPLQLDVIKPFALLHDFMKAVVLERLTDPPYNYMPTAEEAAMHQRLRSIYAGKSETFVAYEVLKRKYPEFAALFLELDKLTKDPWAKVREETRFVHYVDWRILGNKVVPLAERMDYIRQKYGLWIKKKNLNWEAIKQDQLDYEQQIFKLLPFTPEDLELQVNP